MSRFVWKDEYSVENSAVDGDHQTFFALAAELTDVNMTPPQIDDVLARLEQYAAGHFAREEALMAAIRYPGLERHVEAHRHFVAWLASETERYRNAAESRGKIGEEICAFVDNWLVQHILEEDMRYRDYIMTKN
jgi:hemerythrin-like metal-binding protein